MDFPIAVCALILREGNNVLGVSRKTDPNDFGLPGGKVDPGETPEEAIVREVKEETDLDITSLRRIYSHIENDNFLTITYLCEVEGEPKQMEAGVVKDVSWKDLIDGSFGDYNKAVYGKFINRGRNQFYPEIKIKK